MEVKLGPECAGVDTTEVSSSTLSWVGRLCDPAVMGGNGLAGTICSIVANLRHQEEPVATLPERVVSKKLLDTYFSARLITERFPHVSRMCRQSTPN